MKWLHALLRLFRIRRRLDSAPPAETTQATTPVTALSTKLVVMGLDFGTSGTKVVVRLLDKGRPAFAVDFGTDQPGFSRFSFPSTIALEDSRVLFGIDAEQQQEGFVFRSLKRKLLEEKRDLRGVAWPDLPPPPQDLGKYPHFLVAAYLAEVIGRVRELVAEEYGADVELLYNLDIPVSQLNGGPVQRGFQTSLDAAVDFAEANDLLPNDYHPLWGRWLDVLARKRTGLPDQERKRWELIPESSAIVKGAEAGLAPMVANRRRYTAIIDIGAGTTDMGWFRLVTSDEEDCLFFFSAKTSLVGCDDIDDRLLNVLRVLPNDRPLVFPLVRRAKPNLGAERTVDLGRGYGPLCSDDLDRAVDEVADRSFAEYSVSFGEAYKKEVNTDRWRDIRVVLVGGGSQLGGFVARFGRHPRLEHFGRNVDLLLPGTSASVGSEAEVFGAIGVSSDPPIAADTVFLLPALGLSYPAEEIPNPTLPDDIAPVTPGLSGPTGLYDYDAPDDD